jgi:TonB-linked SusC/RagA family outer membrane protein
MKTLRTLLVAALALALAPAAAFAQGGTIRGTVTEQGSGQPLQGVQVTVVGTSQTVVTNQQGRFAINNVAAGSRTVRASRIGFSAVTRTVTVGAQPVDVNFTLSPNVLGLDELVVVGYGQTERRMAPGAIASVRPEEAAETPVAQVDEVLQGRMAGVQVVQNSGVPGAAISVRVRGASSISAGNQPLYVIDGVPLTQGDFSGVSGQLGGQDIDALANLSPNEIESIEVLKDASAAAIYGSRASNGVVLITTKRGRASDRPQVSFNTYYGVQRAWRTPNFLTADQYIEVYNEAIAGDFGIDDYIGYEDDGVENFIEVVPGTNTNWVDEVLRAAPMHSMAGSVTGGTERTRYFVSGARLVQEGIVQSYGFERLNGRVNLDYTVTDRLNLGTSVALTRGSHERARGDNTIYGPFANAIASAPIDPVYNEDGEYNFGTVAYDNPVALALENRAQDRSTHILGNVFAELGLTEGVNARFTVGLDQYLLRSSLYDSPIVGPSTGSSGSGVVTNSNATKVLTEGVLSWDRDLSETNRLAGVLGSSYEDNDVESSSVFGVQFPTEQFRQLNSAALVTGGGAGLTGNDLLSFFGRVSHTWRDRLTTTLNARVDGSSRFSDDNRWGVFPSASLVYQLGDESFMQNQSFVSDLALRVSYGVTGNQEGIGNFASLGLVGGGANYNDRPGLAPAQLPNPDLKWERTRQFNVGTDMAFLNDRLGLTFDYYVKNTDDLLLGRPIPLSTGFGVRTENIGSMRNAGVELAARAAVIRPARTTGFSWNTELNISQNRNKVTQVNDSIAAGLGQSWVIQGQPLGVFYGYVTDGLYRSNAEICKSSTRTGCTDAQGPFQSSRTAPGDIRFKDIDGNGRINAQDRAVIGSPWADWTGGWTNRLAVGGLDLTVFTHFSLGNDIYNANRIYSDGYGSGFDNNSDRALERWTPENPNASEPRATFSDANANTRDSDRFVEDGSFVRLKNVVLGYGLPTSMAGRMGVRSARIYVQGENLATWTDYTGFDPEVNFSGDTGVTRGVDFYTLPQARTISIGLNLGL